MFTSQLMITSSVTPDIISCRDLPRALMIGIPLVTVCYLMTNIAYITVVGKVGILTSGAVAMVM